MTATLPDSLRDDVQTLWDYHNMHHELRPVDVGIGLGSHDLGVAVHTTELYHAGYFPQIVFTGANAPTTVERFPRGEAVHYRDYALEHGVPDGAILVEPRATNTSENIQYARALLADDGEEPTSLILITRPYQQRRAYATAKKVWPNIEILCSSARMAMDVYLRSIGDTNKVINMLVGDTQRVTVYAEKGFAIPQHLPAKIENAYDRLVAAGFTERLI